MTDIWMRVHFVFIWLYLLCHLTAVVQCSEGSIGSTPSPSGWCFSEAGTLDYVLRWLPDSLVHPDGVCESRLGEGSFLCRHRYSGNYSSLCEGLWCRDSVSGECSPVSANDGIPCGNKQWCQNGRCVYSNSAGGTSDSCPFGDSSMPTSQGLSCEEMVSAQPWMCYDSFNEQMCCQSCLSIRRSIQGCPYGDRLSGCNADQCFSFLTDLQSTCCETCSVIIHTLPPTSPTGSSLTSPDSSRTAPSEETTRAEDTTSRQTTRADSTAESTTVSGQSPPTQDSTTVTDHSPPTQDSTTVIDQSPSPQGSTADTGQSSETPNQLTTAEGTQTSEPQTTDDNQQTTGPPESSSNQETTGNQQTSDATVDTTAQGNTADSGSQQAIALGAGLGAGALVLISILVVVIYAIRRHRSPMEHLPVDDSVSANGEYDNRSVDADSFSPQAAGLSESRTTWYPSYRSTTTMA